MTSISSPRTSHRLRVRTREIASTVDLLDLLPSPEHTLAWVRGGEGLVGWGEAARFETSGTGRFADADAWWQRFCTTLDVQDEVGMAGTGPIAFASMAFADEPGRSVLVVPEIVIGRRDGVTWLTECGVGENRPCGTPVRSVQPVRRPIVTRYAAGELPVALYREVVATAVDRMRAGELDKVVLAHDLMAITDGPVDPRFLLGKLAQRYPSCWLYAVDDFVGATPELLLRRHGDVVASRVLAGTTWPRDGIAVDQLAAELLRSAKDREEHEFAVASLADTLRPFCSSLDVPGEPSVLRLHNVLHLASEVSGVLSGEESLLRLAGAVHPTAAVGGTPRDDAVRLIAELERMDRGRYAGPIGWLDRRGGGELGIALRGAEIRRSRVRLFAGCGIVADSDPDQEVGEAAAKLVPMRDALESGAEG